jgi:hypothetical protein
MFNNNDKAWASWREIKSAEDIERFFEEFAASSCHFLVDKKGKSSYEHLGSISLMSAFRDGLGPRWRALPESYGWNGGSKDNLEMEIGDMYIPIPF